MSPKFLTHKQGQKVPALLAIRSMTEELQGTLSAAMKKQQQQQRQSAPTSVAAVAAAGVGDQARTMLTQMALARALSVEGKWLASTQYGSAPGGVLQRLEAASQLAGSLGWQEVEAAGSKGAAASDTSGQQQQREQQQQEGSCYWGVQGLMMGGLSKLQARLFYRLASYADLRYRWVGARHGRMVW